MSNGKTLTQTHDLDYRLTHKEVSGVKKYAYQFDLTNNITQISDQQAAPIKGVRVS